MQLTDGDRIRGLLATYCRLIDAGDFAGVGALMAHAVLKTEDGTVIATGAAEVERLYAGLVKRYDDGTPGTQHVVANAIFDEADVDGSVTVTSTYLVFQAIPEVPLQPILTGTYVDRFEPVQLEGGQDGWRFAERRFGIGRSGVIEHHLSITL
ncbi:nuclear transport factor 2 family protein [Nocardioides sp. LMS-CY]|uniref:nuclear transport factor 2 family protein n=1 Tax=Nocardioides sp. (strain LMS-CY) TaxID=2840457 RepID=UPI001C002282|nr:nuclear transport factor 2 family protein [Nocardioides sp. LMS-CY]QWF21629.1 nuclear transport factor 2 family protein [Nocardioides sp. LMS-CY]